MDGIDAALLKTDGDSIIEECGHISMPYSAFFKSQLKQAEEVVRSVQGDLEKAENLWPNLPQIIDESTHLHAEAVRRLISETKCLPETIRVVGYHGQTLYHHPPVSTIVGHGKRLAELVGIPVVNNFRKQDITLGGQGAPFAPIYHYALAKRDGYIPAVVVNLGGIANVTIIPSDKPDHMIAFDTGPANGLVDRFVRQRTHNQEQMDANGRYGSQGQVHENVLSLLFEKGVQKNGHNYFTLPAPKSLDIGHLNLIAELAPLTLEDGCATLEAFTAKSLVDSVVSLNIDVPKMWIMAGGGAQNPIILKFLEDYLMKALGPGIVMHKADSVGWNSQALEAQIFAYLAVRHLKGLPFSFPNTTGVSMPTCGGDYFC